MAARHEQDFDCRTRRLRGRSRRILWLLDHLTPASDASAFELHLDDPRGVYAWGRRLPPERRDELRRMPIPPSNAVFSRHLQAAMLAWCDSCPDDQVATLLDWREHWEQALQGHGLGWLAEPEVEFYRRCPDADAGRDGLLKSLRCAITVLKDPCESRRDMARYSASVSFRLLLERAARENPGASPQTERTEDWVGDIERTLLSRPFAELAELRRDMTLPALSSEYLAKSFWIWRHGAEQWKQLHRYALGAQEGRVFDRLSEIVPPGELDAWDDLVLDQPVDHGEMRAYCRWLAPQYGEALRTHFHHTDRDWRACAYQNYLAKAPEPILAHRWRRSEDLPPWPSELLDRRLFAPESIRPSAIVYDTQRVESDLRLEDPFNHRAF